MAYEAAEASASQENSPTTDENDRACALACNVCVCVVCARVCVCVFMYVTVRVYARTFTKNEHGTTSAKGQTYVCE